VVVEVRGDHQPLTQTSRDRHGIRPQRHASYNPTELTLSGSASQPAAASSLVEMSLSSHGFARSSIV
jgi:hypothetical protein